MTPHEQYIIKRVRDARKGLEMSERKLTPAEAWSHVKALCTEAAEMCTGTHVHFVMVLDASKTSIGSFPDVIDWPDGVDRWPPIEEWRDAVWPDDWGKPCRWRFDIYGDATSKFKDGRIVGNANCKDVTWIVDTLDSLKWASKCQVRVEPEESLAGPSKEWIAEAARREDELERDKKICPACKLSTAGSTWCSDPKPGCIMPNEPPKQQSPSYESLKGTVDAIRFWLKGGRTISAWDESGVEPLPVVDGHCCVMGLRIISPPRKGDAVLVIDEHGNMTVKTDIVEPTAQAESIVEKAKGPTAQQIDSACLSFRHDFGLLSESQKSWVRNEARWWLDAWQKEGFLTGWKPL